MLDTQSQIILSALIVYCCAHQVHWGKEKRIKPNFESVQHTAYTRMR